MKPEDFLNLLGTLLETAAIPVREKTSLHRSAETVLVMARAYESDGRTFLVAGDPVNALASAWYGFGWLHFGLTFGLLKTFEPAGCPFLNPCESLPPSCAEKLIEKAIRYERLLGTAHASVKPAGERGTANHSFSERVLFTIAVYAGRGAGFLTDGMHEDALACFSYAHGWLDAGVAAGLFGITAHHDLFTV